MRKKIVAGNWKMNTTVTEGVELAKSIVAKVNEIPAGVSLVVAPPFTHLTSVAEVLKGSPVALSAQNCADQPKGAYTGEVSAEMLKDAGCSYTILGHSERREYYGETSEKLVKKMALAFENGLKVIFCVGEKLAERQDGQHFDVVSAQISEVLFGLTPAQMAKVPSEPVSRLPLSRHRKSTLSSARRWPLISVKMLRLKRRFCMAAAASPPMHRNSLHAPISTAVLSAALRSRPTTSLPSRRADYETDPSPHRIPALC